VRHAVVLAGGQGTRLWPWSTAGRPKQLVPLFDGRSLLDLALERAAAVAGEHVWLATGTDLVDAAGGAVAGVDPARVVVEPVGRDTLAALCLAMTAIVRTDPDATVVVLTADHVIEPVAAFVAACQSAFELAEADEKALVAFGVDPDHAATGYGWLELGAAVEARDGATEGDADGGGHHVVAFREKPPRSEAERMLAAGPERYAWNSGMFVWRASALLAAAETFAPVHARVAAEADPGAWDELSRLSVDHGVMEPAAREGSGFHVLAVPLHAEWRDVGAWSSFADVVGRDPEGNSVTGQAVLLDSTECVVASEDPDHLVALVGVEGLVVVHTAEATLVCRADDAQRVKELQALVARSAPHKA
jgi:mannose-1-phosphate guanylyltransferase